MELVRQYLQKHIKLTDAAWHSIQDGLNSRQLKKKEYFSREGQVCRQIGFIVKGCLRLFYLKDGEEITKDFNFEHSFCGSWASFSLQQPSRFNIIAMEDTELYTFTREQLYTWFAQYPELEKMGRLNMEHMFIRKELREDSFLLDKAEDRYMQVLEQYPQILQRVPLKYVASYLGITAETLSRIRKARMTASK